MDLTPTSKIIPPYKHYHHYLLLARWITVNSVHTGDDEHVQDTSRGGEQHTENVQGASRGTTGLSVIEDKHSKILIKRIFDPG